MQEVSQAWKEAHKQLLLPETKVELTLSIADVASMNELRGLIMSDLEEELSNPEHVFGSTKIGDVPKRAILERNTWLLDGSRNVVDKKENYKGIGYVFPFTNSAWGYPGMMLYLNGYWNKTDRVYDSKAIPGITIVWDSENGHYPTHVHVEYFDSPGGTYHGKTITDNSSIVTKIDLEIPKGWVSISIYGAGELGEGITYGMAHPDRRIRIDRIYLGQELAFDKDMILSYSHEQTGDPLSFEVSTGRIEFTIDNTQTNWNMLSPTGIEKYFFDQYPISVRYGMEVNGATEWIKGGTFYLSEWSVAPDGFSSSFAAEDVFGFLRNKNYSRLGITAKAIRSTYCYSDLENATRVDESRLLSGSTWLVNDAGLGVTSRTSTSRVPMLYVHIDGDWYEWAVASDMNITTSTKIGDLVREAYDSSGVSATVPSMFNATIDNIAGPYFVDQTPISEILQKCANVVACGLWQTRDGVLRMQPVNTTLSDYTIPMFLAYSHPKIELTKPLKDVEIVRHSLYCNGNNIQTVYDVGQSGETIVMDNTYLVDSSVEQGLAESITAFWKSRTIVSGDFRADPRLDLFDIVTVETKYGELTPVVITSIKYNYNGAFRGTYTGRIIDMG